MENQNISLQNAGLVLLNNFIGSLFRRLELLEKDTFKDTFAQHKAVVALQYLATGQTITEENLLPYNKVVCGLSLEETITDSISFSASELEIMHGLLHAIMSYWPVIGDTSLDGFRGNWLVRRGILSEKEDHWDVIVEKRSYDILLQHTPFSYAIQKFPWMSKPIYVTWPY